LIPRDYITEWREHAPWTRDSHVEQDLIISRALVELFQRQSVSHLLAFRGGTALHKLYLVPAARYSEDIDLVQVAAGSPGSIMDEVCSVLDPWLGKCTWEMKNDRVTLRYQIQGEGVSPVPMKLKVEVNTGERFFVLAPVKLRFHVNCRWFSGSAEIPTYQLEELLGTKLRALYQRKKCRDLFDLWHAANLANPDPAQIVHCFLEYLKKSGLSVSRAEFEENLHAKLDDAAFLSDVEPLLVSGILWKPEAAAYYVKTRILPLFPGRPWKAGL
jgi:predicted nucleotidyltransferase component of viral defense system